MSKETAGGETFSLELTFDSEGNVKDVATRTGKATVLGSSIPVEDLQKNGIKQCVPHTLLFGWGSPGCIYIRLPDGRYIRVCN